MKKIVTLLVCAFISALCFGQPANDDCVNRELITVQTGGSLQYDADMATATESIDASCDNATNTNYDVWYEFTMPVNGNVRITNVTNGEGFSLFDSCGGSELECFYGANYFYSLTMGATYVLRVSRFTAIDKTFQIEAFATESNNDCANREVISVVTASATALNHDYRGATSGTNSSCDNMSAENLDVWYEFTMPTDGNVRITSITSGDVSTLYDTCGGTELACFAGAGLFYGLTSGTSYVLRMSKASQSGGVVNPFIQAFGQAANDECTNRTPITVSTGGANTYMYDARGATESLDGSCDTAGNVNLDVWYEFTMPVNGNVRITSVSGLDGATLYDSCGGIELDCFYGSQFFYNLSMGTTYVLRMNKPEIFAGAVNFNIEAFATIANDECANRINITVPTGSAATYAYDARAATESLDGACDSAGNQNLDVWYEFTMPVNGNVRITSINNLDGATLYDSCGGTELQCFYGSRFFYNLSMGTTYVLRMNKSSIFAGAVDFDIEAFATSANDECANRTAIAVSTGSATTTLYDTRAATESLDGSCDSAGNQNLDVWYEFTMPVNGNVHITSITNLDGATLYDSCGGTELHCFYGSGFFYNLSMGTTYVLRMNKTSTFAGAVDFDIQAFATIANDDCANRTNIPVPTGSAATYVYDNRGATESLDGSCDSAGNQNLDVWYEFTMPVNGNVRITSLTNLDGATLYDSCGGSELHCFYGSGFFYSLNSGTTYVLRMSKRALFAGSITFNIEAFEAAPNDECAGAISINVGVVAPTAQTADNRGATESLDASCDAAGNTNMDLWYSFEMPVTGNIEITGASSLTGVALYDACGGTQLSCSYGSTTFFGLTGGVTYILRLNRRAVFAGAMNYNIQALAAPLSPCSATTEFIGGVWNNGLPDLTTNAIIRSNYDTAIHGSFTCCSLSVDTNTSLFVRADDYVEVAFNVDVSGTLDINHEGSLVQWDGAATATNNGIIRVRKTTPFMRIKDFLVMGSPMTAETRAGVFGNAVFVSQHTTANFVPNPDVAANFPLAENFSDDNGDFWNQHTGTITPGEGFLIRPQPNTTSGNTTYDLVFEQGTLNNGDVSRPSEFNTNKNDSPNVYANPYASAIFADDFINVNPTIDEVYFWEHLTAANAALPGAYGLNYSMEDISMYNLMGGTKAASDVGTSTRPNGYIASGQGFGVKANAAGTVTFTNAMRRLTNNNTLRDADVERDRLWLVVKNEQFELQSGTLIGFSEEGTPGIDPSYDSRRLATIVSLYSQLETGEGELGIQTREPFSEDVKIRLGFSSMLEERLTYKISIDVLEGNNLSASTVYLIDNELNQMVDLTARDYEFTANKGNITNRFVLAFRQEVLGVEDNLLQGLRLYPNPASDVIYLAGNGLLLKKATVYDLTGRLVFSQPLSGTSEVNSMTLSGLSAGTYLVQIDTEAGRVMKRFVKQ